MDLLGFVLKQMFSGLFSPGGALLVVLLVASLVVRQFEVRTLLVLSLWLVAVLFTADLGYKVAKPAIDLFDQVNKLAAMASSPDAMREQVNKEVGNQVDKAKDWLTKPLFSPPTSPEPVEQAPVQESTPPPPPAPAPWGDVPAAFWLCLDAWVLWRLRDMGEKMAERKALLNLSSRS